MEKKVGNVTLYLKQYAGEDLYSDGNIENDILKIVQETQNFEEVLENEDRWPILYHLSDVRKNILEWYPFNETVSVLEIGAGCGAITGMLCEKVDQVTCVELSQRRALINAYRNQHRENLQIHVGDFNQIHFDEKYDYITLIGVLEYASSFSSESDPYLSFLKKVKTLLKPGGKLMIAIENKYGLKYWAGAKEDHTGRVFHGIEDYYNNNSVRTFSKLEMETMLQNSDFSDVEYFYPMPDYKLPLQIFSDKQLPKVGELRGLISNFDQERFILFDESVVYDGLIENNQFQFFANSFLIVCS